jgi:DNA-binding HxlR family transcriptional regulator
MLFDALGHPFRVKIITVLTKHPLSFAELKRVMNIKSSGHLSFHLGKLNDLVTSTPDGKYQLSEYGHEALHIVTTINQLPPRLERRDIASPSRHKIQPRVLCKGLEEFRERP